MSNSRNSGTEPGRGDSLKPQNTPYLKKIPAKSEVASGQTVNKPVMQNSTSQSCPAPTAQPSSYRDKTTKSLGLPVHEKSQERNTSNQKQLSNQDQRSQSSKLFATSNQDKKESDSGVIFHNTKNVRPILVKVAESHPLPTVASLKKPIPNSSGQAQGQSRGFNNTNGTRQPFIKKQENLNTHNNLAGQGFYSGSVKATQSCIEQKSTNIPVKKRRFDSLAQLIQGDNKCGAACFDGEYILLATNNFDESNHIMHLIDYIKFVAKEAYDLSLLEDKNISSYKEACKRRGELIRLYAQNTVKLYVNNKQYKHVFYMALEKLTSSISHAYLNPNHEKVMNKDVADAIREGRIKYITQKKKNTYEPSLHAEMQILDYLMEDDRREKFIQNKSYIGISKKCCAQCTAAIDAVNVVYPGTVNEILEEDINDKTQKVSYRDTHGGMFRAKCPSFLSKDKAVQQAFFTLCQSCGICESRNLDDIFNAQDTNVDGYYQTHIPSDSDARSLTDDRSFSDRPSFGKR